MSKHTPGPWVVIWEGEYVVSEEDKRKSIGGAVDPETDRRDFASPICQCHNEKRRRELPERLANARLIAAAPDLLAACAAALSLLQNIGKGNWAQTPAGEALRAAITKAEG